MRFFFFSREEERVHVHVAGGDEGKIWIDPAIEVARVHGLGDRAQRPPPAATLPGQAGVYSLMHASSFFATPVE